MNRVKRKGIQLLSQGTLEAFQEIMRLAMSAERLLSQAETVSFDRMWEGERRHSTFRTGKTFYSLQTCEFANVMRTQSNFIFNADSNQTSSSLTKRDQRLAISTAVPAMSRPHLISTTHSGQLPPDLPSGSLKRGRRRM